MTDNNSQESTDSKQRQETRQALQDRPLTLTTDAQIKAYKKLVAFLQIESNKGSNHE